MCKRQGIDIQSLLRVFSPPWFSSGHGEAGLERTSSPGSTLGHCNADTTICEGEEGGQATLVKAAHQTAQPCC